MQHRRNTDDLIIRWHCAITDLHNIYDLRLGRAQDLPRFLRVGIPATFENDGLSVERMGLGKEIRATDGKYEEGR